MNHPEISNHNANLYLAKMIKDADDYRQAKKFARQPKENPVLVWLKKLPAPSTKPLDKPAAPTA